MKKLHYIYIILLAMVISSCTRNYELTIAERKAIGEYKFEKVVRQDGFLSNDNVTQEYNNMILQLNDKKEAAIIDRNNGITYLGKYDVVTQRTIVDDDGNDNTEHTIIIDVQSEGTRGTRFHWVGQDATITNNKMRFTVEKGDGRYRFRLDKI